MTERCETCGATDRIVLGDGQGHVWCDRHIIAGSSREYRLEQALRHMDDLVREWEFRDDNKRFFAQPNEIRVVRESIAEALGTDDRG